LVSFSFADNVRIRSAPETEAAGIAGLEGEVFGWTTPSVTGVDVVGDAPDDFAINVFIAEKNEVFWLRPELIELVDIGVGTTMTVGGLSFVKTEAGEWEQVGGSPQPEESKGFLGMLRSLFGR